ncbi:competence protein ComK [Inediibacterium massiliense]|uniref:competence protein ComK n=1 Tax=Inediibacterium massiliense TaxID=1658111 RepID=UPI0006B5C20B|nr:competence protein ComK [Inediibacterium massiliense]
MDSIEKIIQKGICGVIPTYEKGLGNVTKLITKDGALWIDHRTIKTVLKLIARYYTIHIEACREKYGKIIYQKIGVPILLHKELLLVPFKMRKPLCTYDSTIGYINLYDIEKLKEEQKNTIIQLKNGVEVQVLNRIKTVQDHITKAKYIAREGNLLLRREQMKQNYNHLATKEDIKKLQEEILKLRETIKGVLIVSEKEGIQ